MQLRPLIGEILDYYYWARDRQMEACAALTEEEFLRPLGGSFPSVRETLAHLARVEWLWLERYLGRSPRALPPAEDYLTLPAIQERWRQTELAMCEYVAGLTEESLAETQTYVSTRGDQWTYSRWRMLYHFLNHQSYHRGQVTNLLRQLGHAAPPVDFLNALDARFGR